MKVIYKLRQAGEAVTTNVIAQPLDVAPPSASNMIDQARAVYIALTSAEAPAAHPA